MQNTEYIEGGSLKKESKVFHTYLDKWTIKYNYVVLATWKYSAVETKWAKLGE